MSNSSAMRRTEICRSSASRPLQQLEYLHWSPGVGGRPLRDASLELHFGSLNSATHFATVRHDRSE